MIVCAEQLISEYVDGDLSPPLARALEEHFRVCAGCRAALLDYCLLVLATQLLAAKRQGVDRCQQIVAPPWRRNGLGQTRTSDPLA